MSASHRTAMIFPGQGSQHTGMLAELATAYPLVQQVFAEASETLGYDLWHLVQSGPAEELSLTHITQPAILTSSVAIWRVWQSRNGAVPEWMAGHSLGEYSALVCAGALEFQPAVSLVRQRGELMQSAVPVGTGAMAAILGLEDSAVIAACQSASGSEVVAAVNFNCPGQVVIAGHVNAVNLAIENCKAAGAKRALPLPVSAPFHSPLMKPAALKFADLLSAVNVQAPTIPVLHNLGVEPCSDPALIKQKLVEHFFNPVPWVDTINRLAALGVTAALEIGPGRVLSGFNKRIDKDMSVLAVHDPAGLDEALSQ